MSLTFFSVLFIGVFGLLPHGKSAKTSQGWGKVGQLKAFKKGFYVGHYGSLFDKRLSASFRGF